MLSDEDLIQIEENTAALQREYGADHVAVRRALLNEIRRFRPLKKPDTDKVPAVLQVYLDGADVVVIVCQNYLAGSRKCGCNGRPDHLTERVDNNPIPVNLGNGAPITFISVESQVREAADRMIRECRQAIEGHNRRRALEAELRRAFVGYTAEPT